MLSASVCSLYVCMLVVTYGIDIELFVVIYQYYYELSHADCCGAS